MPRALYRLGEALADWHIVHQSGRREVEPTAELYRKLGLQATVAGFITDLPNVMAASSLAVCRAGGTTLAELAATGLPAVLLPFPDATDDHQRHNAEVFARADAAVIVDQRDSPRRLDYLLADAIQRLLGDPQQRQRMSAAMRRLARLDATDQVVAVVLDQVQGVSAAPLPAAA
jgi:UDP-N-acetylglucosamine--N-acetylmuramyl-(pentapeptide) pyrophosphoryl-undecaprenol N-acetylglucosamine transferase